jgi:hypothetical protein
MKNTLFCFFFLLGSTAGLTQQRDKIRVRAGEDIAQAYSPNGFYRFPDFTKAVLYFYTGSNNTGLRFNYNLLAGNLQFISPRGDTLDLAVPATIDSVVFDNTVLYYREGFLELTARIDSLRLLKKTVVKLDVEKIGAYGQASPTASITNYNSFFSGTGVHKLTINQDVVVSETVSWLLMDPKGKLSKATKSNFLAGLSPATKQKADDYHKRNKVNYEKEADLLKLIKALSE